MDGGIIFFNSFMSYLLLMIIIVCVAALGFVVGRVLRNRKDAGAVTEVSESKVSKAGSDN
jgi:hypothetical protein